MMLFYASFLLLVCKAQSIVIISPSSELVSTLGGRARFFCTIFSHNRVQSLLWLVNGTVLEDANMYNATVQVLSPDIGRLEFHSLAPELNMTLIGCRAIIYTSEGDNRIVNSTVTLLTLQGLLSAVKSPVLTVDCSNITLTWMDPFTLDITWVDPDISYCVDVVEVHSSSPVMLHSECDIRKTNFTYPVLPTSYVINFTISPVNPVGNGTVYVITYFTPESPPELIDVLFGGYNVTLITSAPIQCSSMIVCVDVDTGEIITLRDTDLTIYETNITFSTQLLTENRHYNVTFTASNSRGQAMSQTRISTHDTKGATISNENGRINIVTDFFEYSNAAGALFSFVFLSEGDIADCPGAIYLALDRNTSCSHMLPFSLSPGRYKVFVYDIESDGTLASGVSYPAVNMELIIMHHTQGLLFRPSVSLLESCTVTFTFECIMVECVYNSYYRVTGFQMIAQLSNSSEVHRLYVNKTTDGQTSASVVVEESGIYQVSVLPISGETGILGSFVEYVELLVDIPLPRDISTSTSITTTSTPVTNGNLMSIIVTGMGLGMGILAVISSLLGVVVVILCFKTKIRRWPKETNVQQQQQVSEEEMVDLSIPQLYEEIEEIPTQTASSSRAVPPEPQYEDVIPAARVSKSSDPYHITLCAAYGVQTPV